MYLLQIISYSEVRCILHYAFIDNSVNQFISLVKNPRHIKSHDRVSTVHDNHVSVTDRQLMWTLCLYTAQVLQEIFDMEKNIELIKACILEKEAPMQVAQTRLATRTHRPKIEACRDHVQHRYGPKRHVSNKSVVILTLFAVVAYRNCDCFCCLKSMSSVIQRTVWIRVVLCVTLYMCVCALVWSRRCMRSRRPWSS